MRNIENYDYIKKSNIINLKSEILFREAEDDFFYFNGLSSAERKLQTAIKLTPNHIKSIVLLADICFIKGKIKKALKLYIQADFISGNNPKIIAAIANCYYSLQMYNLAIKYSQSALKLIKGSNFELHSQIIEIKINALYELKRYKRAFYLYNIYKNNFYGENSICLNYNELKEKLDLREKLNRSKLKVV